MTFHIWVDRLKAAGKKESYSLLKSRDQLKYYYILNYVKISLLLKTFMSFIYRILFRVDWSEIRLVFSLFL